MVRAAQGVSSTVAARSHYILLIRMCESIAALLAGAALAFPAAAGFSWRHLPIHRSSHGASQFTTHRTAAGGVPPEPIGSVSGFCGMSRSCGWRGWQDSNLRSRFWRPELWTGPSYTDELEAGAGLEPATFRL